MAQNQRLVNMPSAEGRSIGGKTRTAKHSFLCRSTSGQRRRVSIHRRSKRRRPALCVRGDARDRVHRSADCSSNGRHQQIIIPSINKTRLDGDRCYQSNANGRQARYYTQRGPESDAQSVRKRKSAYDVNSSQAGRLPTHIAPHTHARTHTHQSSNNATAITVHPRRPAQHHHPQITQSNRPTAGSLA